MKRIQRSPFYVSLVLAVSAYLTAANLQGWSLLAPFVMSSARGAHGAPIRHK